MKMNTKIILLASAIVLGAAGIGFTFMPAEIAAWMSIEIHPMITLLGQILGALFLAFAMLNWMIRSSAVGGIYNRPIVVANVAHFSIVGLALLKMVSVHHTQPMYIWIITFVYVLFAVLFGALLFRHPGGERK